jgi:hypothetical protein
MKTSQSVIQYGQFNCDQADEDPALLRADARFIAHLIAIRTNAAELRNKNRTSPADGIEAYRKSSVSRPALHNSAERLVA